MAQQTHRNALQPGFRLHWYEIDRVLGQGGFGITYLARDTNLDQPVAIKEYLPVELAMRETDHSVHPVSSDREAHFRRGLEDFLAEARTLARFDHPSIVRVMSVFEANNTAYMVMRYESGKSLSEMLPRRAKLDEQTALGIVFPILDGLRLVHEAGFIHRDIKPANVYVRDDGSPVLLDFGSAREALGEVTRTLTSLVSPGYAPFEQYRGKGDRQGPWTDIYALGALLYRMIFGYTPMDALDRSEGLLSRDTDPLVSAMEAGSGSFDHRLLDAVDHALAFRPEERPQNIEAWQLMLPSGSPSLSAPSSSGSPFPKIEFPEDDSEAETELDFDLSDESQPPSSTEEPESLTPPTDAAQPDPAEVPQTAVEVPYVALLSSFIGDKGRAQYMDRFLSWYEARRAPLLSWNKAGLLGPLWLVHRKMFLWGLIVQPIIMFVLTIVTAAVVSGVLLEGADLPVGVGIAVLLFWLFTPPALYGNRLYYSMATRRIEQARQRFEDGDEQRTWLARKGGKTWWVPLLLVLGIVLMVAGAIADQQKRATGPNAQGQTKEQRLDEYKKLGREAARRKDLVAAEDYLNKALSLAPDDPQLLQYQQRLRTLKAEQGQ